MMSLILSRFHLAQKMRRHSLTGTRPLCVTVCEMLQSVHRVWGLVCHLFNSEMPLSRGLQQGGKTGMGCLCLPGGLYQVSLFLLPPGKPLLLQTMNSATPPHCFMFTFPPSVGQDGCFFCRGMRGLRPMLRPCLSFSSN